MFTLDQRLQDDTVLLGKFPLSLVLLSRDANYPWCILVPHRKGVTELHHLDEQDRIQLMRESCRVAEIMADIFDADKMNVAALGNVVSQLHIHHIVRYKNDVAWPSPIWGTLPAVVYTDEALKDRIALLRNALSGDDFVLLDSLADLPEGPFVDGLAGA